MCIGVSMTRLVRSTSNKTGDGIRQYGMLCVRCTPHIHHFPFLHALSPHRICSSYDIHMTMYIVYLFVCLSSKYFCSKFIYFILHQAQERTSTSNNNNNNNNRTYNNNYKILYNKIIGKAIRIRLVVSTEHVCAFALNTGILLEAKKGRRGKHLPGHRAMEELALLVQHRLALVST